MKDARNKGRQASKKYRQATIDGLITAEVAGSLQRLKSARSALDKQAYQNAERTLQQMKKSLDQQRKVDFDSAELVARTRQDIDRVLEKAGIEK